MIEPDDSTDAAASRRPVKSEAAFRTISEVSEDLAIQQHVLRFWESKFPQIKPLKRGGGRRYYRPEDVLLLKRIRDLLYKDGYTIRGVQKLLKEQTGKPAALPKPEPVPQPSPVVQELFGTPPEPEPVPEPVILSEPEPELDPEPLAPAEPEPIPEPEDPVFLAEPEPEPEPIPEPVPLSRPQFWEMPASYDAPPPEPLAPAAPVSPRHAFPPGDHAELTNLLAELEDLRALLGLARNGSPQ